jgi:hypothetical protein
MSAGRSCSVSYRYAPAVFNAPATVETDILYVVGGLYGNEQALATVLQLFGAERGRKHLIFNGDFNWFNSAPASFCRINETVLSHDATRGNVETELGPPSLRGDAGCGCAYPEWVGDDVVFRSNAIMAQLASTAASFPQLQSRLAALPMWRRIDVGGTPVGIVHGDAESLAGWGFSRERLADPAHRLTVREWFDLAQVRIFASSHTCLPVMHALADTDTDTQDRTCLVANNGAAGMPNFAGAQSGLLTRIATSPYRHGTSCYGTQLDNVFIDAVPIDYDSLQFQRAFLAQWPAGSPAHTSYWERIANGIATTQGAGQ